jgi:hypothetical protein
LAPVLPLRDQIMDYYLAVPTSGLAMLSGYALVKAWSNPLPWKIIAAVLLAAYIRPTVKTDWRVTNWWRDRSLSIERMVRGTERARQLHPHQAILLDGVDSRLFWAGVFHHPFALFGVPAVYLTPGSEGLIEPHPETGRVTDFVLPPGPTLRAIKRDDVVVYSVGLGAFKAITSAYGDAAMDSLSDEAPQHVELGNPLMTYLLGPEWYPPEDGHRWMPKHAMLRIGGPKTSSEKLRLQGFLAPAQLTQGPLLVRVTVDGMPLPEVVLIPAGTRFRVEFPLPPEAVRKRELQIGLEAGRTFRSREDARDLGVSFGIIEIR